MAKVNNVGLNLNQKIANPFKTSRTSTTNPFKNSDFEGDISFKGSTLVSAEIFEGYVNKKTNKLKMITSSVAGSMTKLRSFIPESITKFVNRVKTNAINLWNGTTNILNKDIVDIGKDISNSVSGSISSMGNRMSNIKQDICNKLPSFNNVTDMSKNLFAKWTNKLNSLQRIKITKDTSVSELKEMWLEINNASMKEVA